MSNKVSNNQKQNIETPNLIVDFEEPLKNEKNQKKRVDINILRSKLQESENKEFKKNVFILTSLILAISSLAIYLSL